MLQRLVDPTAIEAEIDHIRSLGVEALRKRWRLIFEKTPPTGLTKDIMVRMIVYRIQEEVFAPRAAGGGSIFHNASLCADTQTENCHAVAAFLVLS